MNTLTLRSQHLCFGGNMAYYTHQSHSTKTPMNFAVYLPPTAVSKSLPVVYYLSGLTCSEENFTVKSGAQRYAAELNLILVIPDTSPRNTGIPGEDESWDLGSGASFYVDALQQPWSAHYQMYTYITKELPELIAANFPILPNKQGIFGHSMGGHGALVCALRNPQQYLSVSAFAPIVAPSRISLGEKAFTTYLGSDRTLWDNYDAVCLVKKTQLNYPILIDQGTADNFYVQQHLLPELFAQACEQVKQPLLLRWQPEYDHSYFMVSTFIGDHLKHHAQFLH